jgi:two-component system NarL family sensor kinase
MENSIQSGELTFIIGIGVLFMTAFALAFILFFNFSQRKLLAEKTKQQEILLHNIITTQEQERKRIAQDLHDVIGTQLNIINLNLFRLQQKRESVEIFEKTFQEVHKLLNETITTTRQISHELLPSVLDKFGLIEAIVELCDNFEDTIVALDFTYQKDDSKPSKVAELNTFRVLQELINNAIRHGESKTILINLIIKNNRLNLIVEDDGKGFDVKLKKTGLGLSNINSRLEMIHGKMEIDSIINEGSKFYIEVRLDK